MPIQIINDGDNFRKIIPKDNLYKIQHVFSHIIEIKTFSTVSGFFGTTLDLTERLKGALRDDVLHGSATLVQMNKSLYHVEYHSELWLELTTEEASYDGEENPTSSGS